MGSVTDLVQGGLEFSVEPDVWFWSLLQAVGTRRVLCVFSQNFERPFTFDCLVSSVVRRFRMDLLPSSALCFFGAGSATGILFTGLLQSRGLFGDLIGNSAGTWLSAMSVKMAAISALTAPL